LLGKVTTWRLVMTQPSGWMIVPEPRPAGTMTSPVLRVDLHVAGVDARPQPAQDVRRDDLGGTDADHGRHDAP
jgi:hypothetical protein